MLFLTVLVLPCILAMPAEIQPVGRSGILFEQLGNALVYQSEWSVITHVTFANDSEIISFIEKCDSIITELCSFLSKGNKNNTCSYWHKEILNTILNIRTQIFNMELYSSKYRSKRELVNAIGRLSKFLFGTMDDRDAKKIYDRLQNLENHDKENFHLAERQLSIVKSRFDLMDNILQNLTSHQLELEKRLHEFPKRMFDEIRSFATKSQRAQVQAEFNEISALILLKLQQVYYHLSEEYTLFLTLYQRKLHPLILSGQELSKVYEEIVKTELSHSLLNDFSLLTQMIHLDFLQLDNQFLIRLKIPLTEKTYYTLNRIHLLPIPIGKTQAYFLEIDADYLLNNTRNRHYLQYSLHDFKQNCESYSSINFTLVYLCKQNQPKIIGQNPNNCLVNILNNPFSNQPSCSHRVTTTRKDILIKMTKKNRWLYSFHTKRHIEVHCHNTSTQIELQDQGILTLKEKCTYQLEFYDIPFEPNYDESIPVKKPELRNEPTLKFNKSILEKIETHNFNTQSPQVTFNTDFLKSLKSSSKMLEDLDKEMALTNLQRKAEYNSMQTHVNSALVIASIILLMITLTLLLKGNCLAKRYALQAEIPLEKVSVKTKPDNSALISPDSVTEHKDTFPTSHTLKNATTSQPAELDRTSKLCKSFKIRF